MGVLDWIFGRSSNDVEEESLATMLERLETCGIRTAPEVGLSSLEGLYDASEPDYAFLLAILGGEPQREEDGFYSNDILYVDTECIYEDGDYVRLAERVRDLVGRELPLRDLRDHVGEEEARLEFRLDGETHRWDLEVDDDWVDPAFFSRFAELVQARRLGGALTYHDLGGQDFLVGYATEEQRACLNRLPGLHFEWLR